MRKHFSLPEQDVDFLNSSGYQWEAIREGSGNWVIIYSYPIPEGYNVNMVNLALKIDAGYPVSQIDMVYFMPALRLSNNRTIIALAQKNIDGKTWQRWSRHRTGENPWRPGLDDISTHLQMVNFWLERELKR